METYCGPNVLVKGQKFRPPSSTAGFYNVPYSRTCRQYGNDLLQENYNRRPLSPWQEASRSRDRLCPVALAIASFIVLIVVLTVAGLALYMGALHSEFPSPLVSFSCSIKVLRGDRFVGALQEKASRYNSQLETLYKKSVLGPALIECSLDRFGEDTYTIYFRLTLDRKRIPRSNFSLEKNIADIISADLISNKPVFKNVRFVPGSMRIQEINFAPSNTPKVPSPNKSRKRGGVVLKSPLTKNISLAISPTKKKIMAVGKKSTSSQGSFRITKTEADITEKLDMITEKASTKIHSEHNIIPKILHKIASVKKENKTLTETSSVNPRSSVTTNYPSSSFNKLSTHTLQVQTEATTPPLINSDSFDQVPWKPLLFNRSESSKLNIESRINNYQSPEKNFNNDDENKKHLVYTSFTNPSLTSFRQKLNHLGVTSVKGHPLPVNKIVDITEPSILSTIKYEEFSPNMPLMTSVNKESTMSEKDDKIKNISSIFHDLVAAIQNHDMKSNQETKLHHTLISNFSVVSEGVDDINFGQGQVEVVDTDEELLIKATTKLPLVTLLPVKSNSGVGKPLRKRPFGRNQSIDDQEERSFSEIIHLENIQLRSDSTAKITRPPLENFKIVGMLNFASEKMEDESATELVRRAKMESSTKRLPTVDPPFDDELMMLVLNFSVSNKYQSNALTPERMKLLSEISRIHDENNTKSTQESMISTKAVRPIHSVNNFGLDILNKYSNKLAADEKKEPTSEIIDAPKCGKDDFICEDGKCLSKNARCNHSRDCSDGGDEQNCTCADFLRTQYSNKKICDGIVDCWDFSDENNCEWCHPGQHICANSKRCVDKEQICDGVKNCLEGDDERQCLNIGNNLKEADTFLYHSEGFLMVRQSGVWGKLCVDNFHNYSNETPAHWNVDDLGKKVCRSLSYSNMSSINTVVDKDHDQQKMYELSYDEEKSGESSWSFVESTCERKTVVQVSCRSLECGFRQHIVRYRARIVGGKNAGVGSWPWQAALYKEGEFQCGGSLLSDRWILSAGHCFYKSQEYWVARLGALRRSTDLPSPYEEIKPVQKIFIHPGYENNGFVNDIALLRLETVVTFSDYIRPVCLPKLGESLKDDVQCTILGWGQLSEIGRIFPDTLQEISLPVISTTECRKRTVFLPLYNITEEMFCAGYDRGGRDACLGDSGGPLICPDENGRWVIHGITSNGYGCARANRPGVYTKVSSYVKWIQEYLLMTDTDPSLSQTERNSNKCLGHRCPLGQCLPRSQTCNGYTECNDGSDELNC